MGDVCCVFDDAFSLDDLKDIHIDDFVSGLLNVFKYYESVGVFSFYAALFIGPSGQEFFPCHLRITPRTFLNKRDFASDTDFVQTPLSEPVSVLRPETLCSQVKRFFWHVDRRGVSAIVNYAKVIKRSDIAQQKLQAILFQQTRNHKTA